MRRVDSGSRSPDDALITFHKQNNNQQGFKIKKEALNQIQFWLMMSVKGPVVKSACPAVVDDRRRPPSMDSMSFMNIPKTPRVSPAYKINIPTSRLHAKYNRASLSADLYDKTRDLLYLLISHPL